MRLHAPRDEHERQDRQEAGEQDVQDGLVDRQVDPGDLDVRADERLADVELGVGLELVRRRRERRRG